jgi:futalosine hydrolase
MTEFLILVPTPTEHQILEPLLEPHILQVGGTLHLCGFGPVSAAARTSQLIAEHAPSRIILVGIAGSIGPSLSVGSATTFDEVACFGVGAGSGEDFQCASDLGWNHWDSGVADSEPRSVLGDVLPLLHSPVGGNSEEHGKRRQLLTCCSASGCPEDVALKTRHFPNAVAEDMEAFGVAMAATLMNVPVQVVRGISNDAGDRRLSHWKIKESLENAAELVLRLIADNGPAS